MRGKWAAGIVPRNFAWIIKDRLAISERPGGQAPHHRRVRRQEEILWLRGQHFDRIVSLLPSSHNLHAYDEFSITASHFPLPANADADAAIGELYPALHGWLRANERVLLHQEEVSDRLAGVVAGFLCWSGLLPEPPRAIAAAEQLMRRQLGALGRSIVAAATALDPPLEPPPSAAGEPPAGEPSAVAPHAAGPSAAEEAAASPPSPVDPQGVAPGARSRPRRRS